MSGDYSLWAMPHELEEIAAKKMKPETSSAENRATDPLRPAAGGDTPLASQNTKLNGSSYNETMVENIPSRSAKGWRNVVAEWRWTAAMLGPFGTVLIAGLMLYFIPASRGDLDIVRKDMDVKLEIVKAG